MMERCCEENGFVGWFETSAKKGVGMDEAVKCVVNEMGDRGGRKQVEKEVEEGWVVLDRGDGEVESESGSRISEMLDGEGGSVRRRYGRYGYGSYGRCSCGS